MRTNYLKIGLAAAMITLLSIHTAYGLTLKPVSDVKKSDWRRILNEYCTNYMPSCFGIQYIDGTLAVHKATSTSNNNTLVIGFFSYTDKNGKRHNRKDYQAEIEVYNTEVQRIMFRLLRPADMTHTKAYWDECSQNFGEIQRRADQDEYQKQENREYTRLLNNFCRRNYNSCFSGRTYQENSLQVKTITEDDYGIIYVTGIHTYVGRTGNVYKEARFEAKVQKEGNRTRIEFKKESAPDFTHSDYYWERCTKDY